MPPANSRTILEDNVPAGAPDATESRLAAGTITNAMTVDVEDYFQVSAFEGHISRDDWENLPCRVEANTQRVMSLFDRHGVKATFFVLGWVCERFPQLIKDIVANGHELASHGYEHTRANTQDRETFADDVSRTRKLLEDTGGVQVRGYRAASFSIGRDNLWAHDVLLEAGYEYSSRIYPVRHDLYGVPDAPRFPFRREEGGLLEIPITTVKALIGNLPCGGGGYFRLLPFQYFKWAVNRVHRVDGRPSIFYFHPWEVDPEQPRQSQASWKSRFRHYNNLDKMEPRLERLLATFAWGRMDEAFADQEVALWSS